MHVSQKYVGCCHPHLVCRGVVRQLLCFIVRKHEREPSVHLGARHSRHSLYLRRPRYPGLDDIAGGAPTLKSSAIEAECWDIPCRQWKRDCPRVSAAVVVIVAVIAAYPELCFIEGATARDRDIACRTRKQVTRCRGNTRCFGLSSGVYVKVAQTWSGLCKTL